MINFLSSWVKNLSLALIIVSILEMILPNNKTKKYIKMVMGIYILFSIIAPFVENKENFQELKIEEYVKEASAESKEIKVDQTSMDIRLKQIYSEGLEEDIIKKLNEKGYEVDTCKVVTYVSGKDNGIEKITIKLAKKIKKEEQKENENNNNKENKTNNGEIENKIITEVNKISKIEIGNSKNKNNEDETKITKQDINIIKEFIIQEYEVNEKCLKIS